MDGQYWKGNQTMSTNEWLLTSDFWQFLEPWHGRWYEYEIYIASCTDKIYVLRGDYWGTWLIMLEFMDLGWPRVCRHSASVLLCFYYTPRTTKLLGGILVSLRPSVRPSVRLSRLPCPLCNIYSSGWILSILATNDHYHERVCRTQWPLTLTYIFKVIRPWLRKSCPLCSVYSSGWILFIFSTNDHYH